jgi:hypothetical protein
MESDMTMRVVAVLISTMLALAIGFPARADTMYADHVTGLFRGDTTIGFASGWYGGTFPSSFPVTLAEAQARAAVLGGPDNLFLSLPGNEAISPTAVGSAFQWAYLEVGFASNFGANTQLLITELGDNTESAQLFIWTIDGGSVQQTITRGTGDTIVVNLSSYAGFVAAHGGVFTRVGIGGLDLRGVSAGFDVDAVGVTFVPEPSALLLLGSGLFGLGLMKRKAKVMVSA